MASATGRCVLFISAVDEANVKGGGANTSSSCCNSTGEVVETPHREKANRDAPLPQRNAEVHRSQQLPPNLPIIHMSVPMPKSTSEASELSKKGKYGGEGGQWNLKPLKDMLERHTQTASGSGRSNSSDACLCIEAIIVRPCHDDSVATNGGNRQTSSPPVGTSPISSTPATSSVSLLAAVMDTVFTSLTGVPNGKQIPHPEASIFMCVYSRLFSLTPKLRELAVDDLGYMMVTHKWEDIVSEVGKIQSSIVSFDKVALPSSAGAAAAMGAVQCPCCGKHQLSSDGLWHHYPQYHIGLEWQKQRRALRIGATHSSTGDIAPTVFQCPVRGCGSPESLAMATFSRPGKGGSDGKPFRFQSLNEFADHLFHDHPPAGLHIAPCRPDVKLHSFALVVVRRPQVDGKFLLVQERSRCGWWLPGGGIDSGEDPIAGGVRETLEEAGVHVDIKGLLSIRIAPSPNSTRLWYIFYAEPVDQRNGGQNCEAKTLPDHESVGACWVSLDEMLAQQQPHQQQATPLLSMRGSEPLEWFPYVANGGTIYPMSLLNVMKGRL